MAKSEVRQRLAAILAADVAGYSRLMGDNERATIATLDEYRAVFQSFIDANNGRVVDMAGDSVLAIFDTASGAVRAAIDAQAELGDRNEGLPAGRRMEFRVGINSGDIQEAEDGRVYGDGVNVAARLEALASPGGVNVSGSVFDSVRSKVGASFDFLGEHDVKNIAEPVRAYRFLREGETAKTRLPRLSRLAAAAAIVAPLGVGWWLWEYDVFLTTADTSIAPSLAVMAFGSLSDKPQSEQMASSLTSEVSNGFSHFRDLRIVSAERGTPDYVLQGIVQHSGDLVRVSVELFDSDSGDKPWGRRYERRIEDGDSSLAVNAIAQRIVSNVADPYGAIATAEVADVLIGNGGPPAGYDCITFAKRAYSFGTIDDHVIARDCLEVYTERQPEDSEGWAWLSIIYLDEATQAYPSRDGFDALAGLFEVARRTLTLAPNHEIALTTLGIAHFLAKEYDQSTVVLQKAITKNPYNTLALGLSGSFLPFSGDWENGLAAIDLALELNPDAPAWMMFPYIWNHMLQDEYEAAAKFGQQVVVDWDHPWSHATLAIAYAHLGKNREARIAVERILAHDPAFPDTARELYAFWFPPDGPWPGLLNRIISGLEKAGLFDEPGIASRPVIAVLPFDNLSARPEQDYFAQALAADISTAFTHFDLKVVASDTAAAAVGTTSNLSEIIAELGADYLVKGSVRRSGETLRLTVQLIEGVEGSQIWGQSFDADLEVASIFELMDELTQNVAAQIASGFGAINVERFPDLNDRVPGSMDSYDCYLRAVAYQITLSPEENRAARTCLENALESDPSYSNGWAQLANMYTDDLLFGFNRVEDAAERALEAANRSVRLSPRSQVAYAALAHAQTASNNREGFVTAALKAADLNPNDGTSLAELGAELIWAGEYEKGKALLDRGISLNPHYFPWVNLGLSDYWRHQGEVEKALEYAEKCLAEDPDNPGGLITQISLLGLLGRGTEAAKSIDRLEEVWPNIANDVAGFLGQYFFSNDPKIAKYLEGMRDSGFVASDRIN